MRTNAIIRTNCRIKITRPESSRGRFKFDMLFLLQQRTFISSNVDTERDPQQSSVKANSIEIFSTKL